MHNRYDKENSCMFPLVCRHQGMQGATHLGLLPN